LPDSGNLARQYAFPRVGFIVTNRSLPNERVLEGVAPGTAGTRKTRSRADSA